MWTGILDSASKMFWKWCQPVILNGCYGTYWNSNWLLFAWDASHHPYFDNNNLGISTPCICHVSKMGAQLVIELVCLLISRIYHYLCFKSRKRQSTAGIDRRNNVDWAPGNRNFLLSVRYERARSLLKSYSQISRLSTPRSYGDNFTLLFCWKDVHQAWVSEVKIID